MLSCAAPWYELNLSAPDNNASACCYYGGEKEEYGRSLGPLESYWNGPGMQALRRLQRAKNPPENNGCSNCFFFTNKPNATASNYFDFNQTPPADISPEQLANWQLAKSEYEQGLAQLKSAPMRFYANFGYTCNLACKMCHQVPRRQEIDRFIACDDIYLWENDLRKMLEVCVIGGEPFAMPEAVKFIRRFAADDTMDAVRLSVFTNGTVHHKHMEVLRKKRKLGVCVSLDSIHEGYENIRVGSKWNIIERNVLMVKEAIEKDRPEWILTTNGIIMKTGVPFLPEFARWHVKHGIQTQFLDFVNFRGTEDVYYSENLLYQPHILDDIAGWEENFQEAIEIFKSGSAVNAAAAASLEHFYTRVVAVREESQAKIKKSQALQQRNDWKPAYETDLDEHNLIDSIEYVSAHPDKEPNFDPNVFPYVYKEMRSGDVSRTKWIKVKHNGDGTYKLQVEWPKVSGDVRHTYVALQCDYGEIDGFRTFREVGRGTVMTMSGSIPKGVTKLRILIYPVGEVQSMFPTRLGLETDLETELSSDAMIGMDESGLKPGFMGMVSNRRKKLEAAVKRMFM